MAIRFSREKPRENKKIYNNYCKPFDLLTTSIERELFRPIEFPVYHLTLFCGVQINRNRGLLEALTYNKKSPTARGDCGATGSMGFA